MFFLSIDRLDHEIILSFFPFLSCYKHMQFRPHFLPFISSSFGTSFSFLLSQGKEKRETEGKKSLSILVDSLSSPPPLLVTSSPVFWTVTRVQIDRWIDSDIYSRPLFFFLFFIFFFFYSSSSLSFPSPFLPFLSSFFFSSSSLCSPEEEVCCTKRCLVQTDEKYEIFTEWKKRKKGEGKKER